MWGTRVFQERRPVHPQSRRRSSKFFSSLGRLGKALTILPGLDVIGNRSAERLSRDGARLATLFTVRGRICSVGAHSQARSQLGLSLRSTVRPRSPAWCWTRKPRLLLQRLILESVVWCHEISLMISGLCGAAFILVSAGPSRKNGANGEGLPKGVCFWNPLKPNGVWFEPRGFGFKPLFFLFPFLPPPLRGPLNFFAIFPLLG